MSKRRFSEYLVDEPTPRESKQEEDLEALSKKTRIISTDTSSQQEQQEKEEYTKASPSSTITKETTLDSTPQTSEILNNIFSHDQSSDYNKNNIGSSSSLHETENSKKKTNGSHSTLTNTSSSSSNIDEGYFPRHSQRPGIGSSEDDYFVEGFNERFDFLTEAFTVESSTLLYPCRDESLLSNPFDDDALFAVALQNSLDDAKLNTNQNQFNLYEPSSNYSTKLHTFQPATSHEYIDEEINFKNNSNQKNTENTPRVDSVINSSKKLHSKQEEDKKTNSDHQTDRLNSTRKRTRPPTIEDEDVVDLHNKNNNRTNKLDLLPQQENNLLNNMPIQSTTEGSGAESSDHPTLSSQNSKRIQQVPGVGAVSNEPTSPTSGSVAPLNSDQSSSSSVNNKMTLLFSDEITYKHLVLITSKNAGDVLSYQITIKFDEKSSYTNKSEPTKHCQFKISAKTDLKRLIELISDHTNLPITTVCFKKTLGGRQKILPLSTKLSSVFDKITLQKPVDLFVNGKEFLELDYNNMYTEAGNDLFREKKYEEALECYNTSLQHHPNESRVMSNRALCLIKLNKFYEAFNDLSNVIASDKTDPFFEKALHRRAHATYELTKNLKPNEEMTNLVNSLVSNTRVKDESLEVKLYYLCLKDMQNYLEKVGIPTDYAAMIRKKELDLNDVKLIKSFHYLLQQAPKMLNYCLITKKEVSDLKLSTVFPASIYSPENKDSSLIYTPLPFCSREWYDSEMARYEELFSVKLWKPFYDNNENINGKAMTASELYKVIIFTTFKYLLTKPDFGTLLTNELNAKIFGKILIYLAFGAGVPPKAYLYINNKSDETKITMREYTHQNTIEYIHIQVRDFHFIVEFKQPASSNFSSTDSSYGSKENRVKPSYETFLVRVGDELPTEVLLK